MELPSKILVYIIKMKLKRKLNPGKRKTNHGKQHAEFERRVLAVELPLRMRVANMGGIVARNEKLNALKAYALRSDIQRVEQMMEGLPMMQRASVSSTAQQLKKDLDKLAGR